MDKENILGIRVSTASLDEILALIVDIAKTSSNPLTIACANPHSLMVARKDKEFFEALNHFDVLLPDGIGMVYGSRLLKGSLKQKIGGPDLFRELSNHVNTAGGFRYFFLGSTEEILAKIKENMKTKLPSIELVGTYSPPFYGFSEKENEEILDAINTCNPTVLWVGMTAPKQEKWIYRNRAKLKVPIIGAVGAAFDYFAESKKRPQWMIDRGLGWLYRLISEPRRLWRRYFVSAPLFMYLIFKKRTQ